MHSTIYFSQKNLFPILIHTHHSMLSGQHKRSTSNLNTHLQQRAGIDEGLKVYIVKCNLFKLVLKLQRFLVNHTTQQITSLTT